MRRCEHTSITTDNVDRCEVVTRARDPIGSTKLRSVKGDADGTWSRVVADRYRQTLSGVSDEMSSVNALCCERDPIGFRRRLGRNVVINLVAGQLRDSES